MNKPKPMPSYWTLAEEVTDLHGRLDQLKTENAKLRDLVGDIWEFGFSNSAGANSVKEWYRIRDELEQRVYTALGIEVKA